MDKRLYKICEAVALGIDHYYIGKWHRIELTPQERAEALVTIPTLPAGWMLEKQEWHVCRGCKGEP